MSLIDERGDKRVRMANLACVGSHAVNGVAQLHSDLLKQTVLRDFAELEPEKFTNVTNGVTPRRFLLLANPGLAALITEAIGDKWLEDLNGLRELEARCDDGDFCERWRQVKQANKQALAAYAQHAYGIELLPDTMFDVQVKRIHEYKRQHLNVLHAVALYRHLKRGGDAAATHHHLRRQGGAGLPHGQVDHQADPQRCRSGERRPRNQRSPAHRFSS